MLKQDKGFTLVELLITLLIIAVLLAISIPNISTWVRNASVRANAESLQSGLQMARTEAIRRNNIVRFQIVSTLASGCTTSTSSANWIISLDDVTANGGACNESASETNTPRIIQKKPGAEVSDARTNVTADTAVFVFNGLGQRTSAPTTNASINITHSSGSCNADGGTVRCLRLVVSRAGQIRMCDPDRDATDPMGCQ
ncbi:MAG: hypothetical protein RLZZ352_611 [Pseudomonadota bacterium]|jgi:type IV fimbrial biogenesis protein FimT